MHLQLYPRSKHAFPRRGTRLANEPKYLPKEPLASYDTREGFEQHRAWERHLWLKAAWSMRDLAQRAGRPRQFGLIEWLIFEEEYYRADAPDAGQPERPSSCSALR